MKNDAIDIMSIRAIVSGVESLRSQIQQLVRTSGKTRNAIAVETGLDPVQLHRLVHGKPGVSLEAIEKIAMFLGHRVALVSVKETPASSRQAKGGIKDGEP